MVNFVIGLLIGGLAGVFVMCMVQINHDNKIPYSKDETDEEKKA